MYKLNNIALDTYGILAVKMSGEDIAVKGIFDLPARIGDTHNSWDDTDSVEPYVNFGQLLYGGRTLLFSGVIVGTKATCETKLAAFKLIIAAFKTVVKFETPYGTACVFIKKITSKVYNEGISLLIEMREPEVGATCAIISPETIYYSEEYSESTAKNDCGTGYYGSTVQLTAIAGKFTSTYSQLAANQLAINWVKENKQLYANQQGTCIINPTIYYNTKKFGEMIKNDCSSGYFGSTVTYEIPAYTYSSLVSQIDADAKAQTALNNYLTQAYTNSVGYCTLNPQFTQTANYISQITIYGSIRKQKFLVGEGIVVGTVYNIMIYAVTVSYTSILGDTPTSIVNQLITKINATTEASWNFFNQAPLHGTPGFKPVASIEASNILVITLNASTSATHWIGDKPRWDVQS